MQEKRKKQVEKMWVRTLSAPRAPQNGKKPASMGRLGVGGARHGQQMPGTNRTKDPNRAGGKGRAECTIPRSHTGRHAVHKVSWSI